MLGLAAGGPSGSGGESSAPVSVDSTHSLFALRGFLSSSDSLSPSSGGNSGSVASASSTMTMLSSGGGAAAGKPVPSKPPRKSIGNMLADHLGGKYHKFQSYERVSPPLQGNEGEAVFVSGGEMHV